jgi:16S rRNA (guanine527-N7)-methyltransferase
MKDHVLEEGLSRLGLHSERNVSLLSQYIAEIVRFNGAYGLVNFPDLRTLTVKHILDSLGPWTLLRDRTRSGGWIQAADLGSGAGLPGIPLAICLEDYAFALVERKGRRAGFLRNCQAALGLDNISVEEMDFERASPGSYDFAVFRALKPLTAGFVGAAARLLKPGGFLAAYKGQRAKAQAELAGLTGRWDLLPVEVPFLEEERSLALLSTAPRQ